MLFICVVQLYMNHDEICFLDLSRKVEFNVVCPQTLAMQQLQGLRGLHYPTYYESHYFQAPVPILESFHNCRVQPVFQSVIPSLQPQGLHGLISPIERDSHLFHLHPCKQCVNGKYKTYMGYSYPHLHSFISPPPDPFSALPGS